MSEKFWSKVDILGPDECWRWKAAHANGHGLFTFQSKSISARRMAWNLTHNEMVPKGTEIHITCNTPDCCNPSHLFLATLKERFERGFTQGKPDECWEWQGARTKAGYGVLNEKGKLHLVHRFSWECFNGPIPLGMEILHRCDNPPCLNPAHLFLGDQTTNVKDAKEKGRISKGESHINTKLNEGKVHEIKYQLELGVPATKIAKRFGVSRGTIMDIKHNRTWKHVDSTP